jgi:hypothetical protein
MSEQDEPRYGMELDAINDVFSTCATPYAMGCNGRLNSAALVKTLFGDYIAAQEAREQAEERIDCGQSGDEVCGKCLHCVSEMRDDLVARRAEALAEAATLRERCKALEDAAQKLVDAASNYQYDHDTYGRAASVTCESFCRLIAAADECGVLLIDPQPAAQKGVMPKTEPLIPWHPPLIPPAAPELAAHYGQRITHAEALSHVAEQSAEAEQRLQADREHDAREQFSDAQECESENTVYLCSRYSRFPEMQKYADQLRGIGFKVSSRWIEGNHQLQDGVSTQAADEEGKRFALEDWDDLKRAGIVIAFTEPPRGNNSRGGRHVEYGAALAMGKRCIVIGTRENVFHLLPQVERFDAFEDAAAMLEAQREKGGE